MEEKRALNAKTRVNSNDDKGGRDRMRLVGMNE